MLKMTQERQGFHLSPIVLDDLNLKRNRDVKKNSQIFEKSEIPLLTVYHTISY